MARVIVAHEYRTYREACAEALRIQRTTIDFEIADPEQLEELLETEPADLIIVSEMPCNIRSYQGKWLLLYPEGTTKGVISVGPEEQVVVENFSFSDLLAVVDQLVESKASHDVSGLQG